jgi:hypothetical protein
LTFDVKKGMGLSHEAILLRCGSFLFFVKYDFLAMQILYHKKRVHEIGGIDVVEKSVPFFFYVSGCFLEWIKLEGQAA